MSKFFQVGTLDLRPTTAVAAEGFTTQPSVTPSSGAVGDTLTMSRGSWKGSPTATNFWTRDGETIAGQTGLTYVLTTADVGKNVQGGVRLVYPSGSSPTTGSTPQVPVTEATGFIVTPTLNRYDSPAAERITMTPGTWRGTPTSVAYNWLNGATVLSNTRIVHDTAATAGGSLIKGRVTLTYANGTVVVADTPVNTIAVADETKGYTTQPTLGGSGVFGTALTITPGVALGTVLSRSYAWYEDAALTVIPGETTVSYTPPESKLGKVISAIETLNYASGVVISSTMTKTVIANEGFSAAPTLAGNTPMGQTLTATDATPRGTPTSVVRQWARYNLDPIVVLTTTGTTRNTGPDDVGNEIRVRQVATYGTGTTARVYESDWSNGITVTAVTGGTITFPAIDDMASLTSTASVLQFVPSEGRYDYRMSHSGYVEGGGVSNTEWSGTLPLIGYEAWRGNTVAQGRLVQWLNRWTTSGKDPSFSGGYNGQHMCNFCDCAAWAKATPAVWNALSTSTQNKVTALMKLALWQIGMWREEADNPQFNKTKLDYQNSSTAEGNSNPNIAAAFSHLWYAAAWFYGGIAAALTYINTNSLQTLVNSLAPATTANPGNLGLANAYAVWGTDWGGGSPTIAEVQARARSRQSRRGTALTDPVGVICQEIDYTYSEIVVKGYNNGAGISDSEYGNGMTNAVAVPQTLRNRYPGHTKQGRMFLDPAVVSPTRWAAILGQVGMCREFDTRDIKTGTSGPRSAVSYAWKAQPHVVMSLLLLFASGFVHPSAAAIQSRRTRLFVGFEYMWFTSTYACGYDGVAHVGSGDGNGNSVNIEPGNAEDKRFWMIDTRLSANDAVLNIIDQF